MYAIKILLFFRIHSAMGNVGTSMRPLGSIQSTQIVAKQIPN